MSYVTITFKAWKLHEGRGKRKSFHEEKIGFVVVAFGVNEENYFDEF